MLSVPNSRHLYEVPMNLFKQNLPHIILGALRINKVMPDDMPEWNALLYRVLNPVRTVQITIVGKYIAQLDAYLSLRKALLHAGTELQTQIEEVWVDAATLEDEAKLSNPEGYAAEWAKVNSAKAILVPGGFGIRGIEGMIKAISVARSKKIPYLGICLGMQMAVCEFARNVMGLEGANSEEFDPQGTHRVARLHVVCVETHRGECSNLSLIS